MDIKSNITKLKSVFPNVFVNSKVNLEKLKELLGEGSFDYNYGLYWKGKKEAYLQAFTDTKCILKLCNNEGVNEKTTENILIEGDNLDVLKLLQKDYKNKIKMIYIDPPYNTGNEFIYKDDFKAKYGSGINEKLHTNWLNMIYPRLLLAKELLRDDGIIFISIDDNELFNLKLVCDEIFGEENFVNCIAVKMSEATGVKMTHQYKRFPKIKEYILFYKNKGFDKFVCIDKYRQENWDKENNIFLENMTEDIRSKLIMYKEKAYLTKEELEDINFLLKNVKLCPLAKKIKELNLSNDKLLQWKFDNAYRIVKTVGSNSLHELIMNKKEHPNQDIASTLSNDKVLFFYITNYNKTAKQPRLRVIFADENIYKNPCDFWQDIKTSGAISIEGGIKYKNGKKPLKLLKRLIKMTTEKDDIILDFFAGSGSTAHAVMEQNSEDNQKRKFILVQIPENLDENYSQTSGEAKNDIEELIKYLDRNKKPHYITEITKERLRYSGKGLNVKTDIGFKVYKSVKSKT